VEQKNRAIEAASHDWILSIDADERLSEELVKCIQELEPEAQGVFGYSFPRLSWWMGRPIRHGSWYPDARVRLFDRRRARWGGRNPHDRVELEGPSARLDAVLIHHPYRDMGEHLRTIDRYTQISADTAIQAGLRAHCWDPVIRPALHFVKAILFKMGFLDGVRGWCLAVLGAAYVSLKWTRIYLADEPQDPSR
jgi:glycosyltransferase involved in cell wall biosynthesis